MSGFDHKGDEFFRCIGDVHHVHLGARNHDVAHLHLGNLEHPFDHGQRIRIQQVALEGGMQQFDQLFAVFRLPQQERA